jgi:hypothetical protein
MDMSLVSAALATLAGHTRMQIAATIMNKNADATLLGEPSSQANLGAPVSAEISTFRFERATHL